MTMTPKPKSLVHSNRLFFLLVIILVVAVFLLFLSNFSCLENHSQHNMDVVGPQQQQQQRAVSKFVIDRSPIIGAERHSTTNRSSRCLREYDRVTASLTPGLTQELLDRSKVYLGNRERAAKLVDKLRLRQKAVNVVVCGGSITIGHGIFPKTSKYLRQLEDWMNTFFPVRVNRTQNQPPERPPRHMVHEMAGHGADMCAMAKRINLMRLPQIQPDLVILEFGVNDYQGQDFDVMVDDKTDVFFDGFRVLATCAEVVVHRLLSDYPEAAVVFLEFQTAILNRKTAQLLHMGAALHYEVPVLSYADAMFRPYYQLIEKLKPYHYSVPSTMDVLSVQPYPHGCAACHLENLTDQFQGDGCRTLCEFVRRSELYQGNCDDRLLGLQPCYVPIFAHDEVHPSAVGHTIATDLIVDWIAATMLQVCQGRKFAPHVLPTHSGWLTAGPNYQNELRARSDFVLVRDTIQVFGNPRALHPDTFSKGFELTGDGYADRKGWVATNPLGGESISFDFNLPPASCYEVFLSVLRSYNTVGTFTVSVEDLRTNKTTAPQTFDCLWQPRISIPVDFQLTRSQQPPVRSNQQCTGKCRVSVRTLPEIKGRGGNKIKIMSLSVRKCVNVSSKELPS